MDRRRSFSFIVLAALFFSLFTLDAFAKPVTADKAKAVALKAVGNNLKAMGKVPLAKAAGAAKDRITTRMVGGKEVYHTVQFAQGGWAVVAADDTIRPVLAYSDDYTTQDAEPPPAYKYFMDELAARIKASLASNATATPTVAADWQVFEETTPGQNPPPVTDVAPLLSTTWNQGTGYNTYCPVDAAGPGGRAWAGCLATAMAQIMNYHEWPLSGIGSSTYTTSKYGSLTVNYAANSYNYGLMEDNAGSDQAAKLTYHAGVAVKMNYAPTGSGATVANARLAFINYFRYHGGLTESWKYQFTDQAWADKLTAEIDAGRPVLYAGYNATSGHAWVCDGYRTGGEFHMNWGWGGAYNGYFYLTDLTPGSSNYTTTQEALFGLYPYKTLAAKPTFNPPPGTYAGAKQVTMATATVGGSIRYSNNTVIPTSGAGALYATPVAVPSTVTLKAVAFKAGGFAASYMAQGTYTIVAKTAVAPTFSLPAGTYSGTKAVTLASATPGATIRYTTDGIIPTQTNGTVYSAPISVAATQTIKAIAFVPGQYGQSAVSSALYTIVAQNAAPPVFSLPAGTYSGAKSITLTSATVGAVIRYTTNGTAPSQTAGTVYSAAIPVSTSQTIKAIAFKPGQLGQSALATAAYTLVASNAAPVTFNLAPGTYNGSKSVTLASTTAGATIRYTTNGSVPTLTAGTVYSGPVDVAASQTIKAIAFKPTQFGPSAPTSAAYVIVGQVAAAPAFSLCAGTYAGAKSVALTSATVGATIRYTTNGSAPSQSTGLVYSAPITVSTTQTIKAIAFTPNTYGQSPLSTAAYTIKPSAAAVPRFTPNAGSYASAQTVSITSTSTNAVIRYTTNGQTPTQATGTVYSSPFQVAQTTTIKAIAYVPGTLGQSALATGAFTIQGTGRLAMTQEETLAQPVLSITGGSFENAVTLTISSPSSGAAVYYTLDGSSPTPSNGKKANGPVTVDKTALLTAAAYLEGFKPSPPVAASFVIANYQDALTGGAFRYVAPGEFNMGTVGEGLHRVRLTEGYYLLSTEVTSGLWQKVMGGDAALCPECPAACLSFTEAVEFVAKLNQLAGAPRYALPTEAEWEYAAKGGHLSEGYRYPGTDEEGKLADFLWFTANSGQQPKPVGLMKPNELGLFDMGGNVAEWVADYYGPFGSGEETNPAGPPQGASMAVRGGSFASEAAALETSARSWMEPEEKSSAVGFRLLCRP